MKNGKHTDEDGTEYWCQNGEYHRDNAPALICTSGYKAWYQNGKIHRDNAPALIYANGTEYWYHYDVMLSEAEIQKIKRELEANRFFRDLVTI